MDVKGFVRYGFRSLWALLGLAAVMQGCASVPASSPELSGKLTEGIYRLRDQHVVTLDKLYDAARARVNDDYEKFHEKAIELFSRKNAGKAPASKQDFMTVSIITSQLRDKVMLVLEKDYAAAKSQLVSNYEQAAGISKEITNYLKSAVALKQADQAALASIKQVSIANFDLSDALARIDVGDIVKKELEK